MTRHKIASVDELAPGDHKIVEIGPTEVAVFNINGSFYALPNICPHQYGPLCEHGPKDEGTLVANTDGELEWDLEGEIVACPWHNLEFNIKSGESLSFKNWDLNTFEVISEDGNLYVES